MEEQLLPSEALRPAWDKVVWLYVYRDFSGSEDDLAAERVCVRLGFTSYPQHHLLHPATLERLASTGRSEASFLAAVANTHVKASRYAVSGDLREADARAAALRRSGSVAAARKALEDRDVVVRIRALEILVEKDPKAVAAKAADLLQVPNDPLRYLACEALQMAADPRGETALVETVRQPKDSLNPNVLRIRAVQALGTCGGPGAVEAVAPHAAGGVWNNGLTRIAVQCLVDIAGRHPKARRAVKDALADAYPFPPEDETGQGPKDAGAMRSCLALARSVHEALEEVTGKKTHFPKRYTKQAVETLRVMWKRVR